MKHMTKQDDHGNNKDGKIQLINSMMQDAKYDKHST